MASNSGGPGYSSSFQITTLEGQAKAWIKDNAV